MKTLLLLSHTYFDGSKVNRALFDAVKGLPDVTARHLEEIYGFDIRSFDIATEHALIESADRIIMQFPIFWFSMPALLKAYIDEVFTHGWAYGSDGNALVGKELQVVVTTGSDISAYSKQGSNKYSVDEFLLSLRGTAGYCGMTFNKIFVVDGVLGISDERLNAFCLKYKKLVLNELNEDDEEA
ncbi:NAD(P)H-dependent oxidoreductase [Campylobacter sp. faydin G-24]|uniref:NAD(P)H-dependent oxidoreductase n=1 Tax=Campylobacter anatolicus TaxID=2829105 RepID=A0ABS5HG93_9BACT|nr:NAD(P)H-dependent oxidoreductase [Campylobacter anatolicus]MBR8463263.1 NAD(P)H-dependent oxidoreductase [Campylobacter anatolicus]MBR8465423.1 NAD(P)H-dependent oxidoreductase [Campylobacter anatolicus]